MRELPGIPLLAGNSSEHSSQNVLKGGLLCRLFLSGNKWITAQVFIAKWGLLLSLLRCGDGRPF